MKPEQCCVLCGGADAEIVGERDRSGAPLRTVCCRACGLAYSDPRPPGDELERYYAEHYRAHYKGTVQPRPRHVYRAGRVALDRWRRLRDCFDAATRALDVGAGGGEWLYVLGRMSGCDARGLEPNRGYAEHARAALGLAVDTGFVDRDRYAPGAFDAITLFHVLEHLGDPRHGIGVLAHWLAPGGRLIVEVPNIDATCQSPRNTFHSAHLFHFSHLTLEQLGRSAGLVPERRWTSPDGGNIEVVFRRPASAEPPGAHPPALLAAGAARSIALRRRHTPLRHALAPPTWARFVRKIGSQLRERIAVRAGDTPRAILDRLIERARHA